MKLPWRMARNLNLIGSSMKHVQEICSGRKRVKFQMVNLRNGM